MIKRSVKNGYFIQQYTHLAITLLLVWSISLLCISLEHFVPNLFSVWVQGIINQLIAASLISLVIYPFYLIFKNKWFTTIVDGLYLSIVLFEIISSFYFIITLQPIDQTIFQFESEQMGMIAGDFLIFKWYYIFIVSPVLIYFFVKRKLKKSINISLIMWLAFNVITFFVGLQIGENQVFQERASKNKLFYFFESFYRNDYNTNIETTIAQRTFQGNENHTFTSSKYPLIHLPSKSNPLQQFIETEDSPPNIVFIIVESLSSSFSGINADEISYTPFLDSLSLKSITFENTLATGERTFAALPSILGSLPHGPKGFTHENHGYPSSNTLVKWLKDNKYITSFYYGGHSRFDYMDLFLNDQGIDVISDRDEFDYSGTSKKTSIDEVPFGITDKLLFEDILLKSENNDGKQPYLDIILTLSMHYPFIVEDNQLYIDKTDSIIEHSDASKQIKRKHQKYKKALSTILYTDEVLADYFEKIRKKKSFKNTIFLITGDHMMGDLPNNSPIEKYRVPMMIYSPLIKKAKRIKAVNSHLDIAPTLYNFLIQNYDFNPLESIHWLGYPIDTSSEFRNQRSILFMRNDRTCPDFIDKGFFISKNNLYAIDNKLQLEANTEKKKKEQLSKLRSAYRQLHHYTVKNNKIKDLKLKKVVFNIIEEKVIINDSIEFKEVFNIPIDKKPERIMMDLKIQLEDNWFDVESERNEYVPILVFALKRKDEHVIWKKINLEKTTVDSTKIKSFSILLKDNLHYEIQPNDRLLLYFWNKEKNGEVYESVINSLKLYVE